MTRSTLADFRFGILDFGLRVDQPDVIKNRQSKIKNAWPVLCLCLLFGGVAQAAETKTPSLFRGVVASDAQPGARVVSLDEESVAYAGGLRPGDVIAKFNGAAIGSIDDFALQSQHILGKMSEATLVVERGGQSIELLISLFSQRLLDLWGERFVPNLELRFRDPKAGYVYWWSEGQRAARNQRVSLAIEALETALHYQPEHHDAALLLAGQWSLLAQARFTDHRNDQGVAALQHAVNLYQRLAAQGTTAEALTEIKAQLQQLVSTLGAQLPAAAPASEPETAPPGAAAPTPTYPAPAASGH